jgi:histidinol-phosphate aminotransferase
VKIPWNLPAVVLAAAEAALEDSAEHEERVSALKVARAELAERLSDLPGLSILESDGNFISIDISSTGLSAADFVAAALAEGVLIRSLETHHATRRFVRVTVGTRAENARCVRALERVLSRRGVARLRLVAASSDAE